MVANYYQDHSYRNASLRPYRSVNSSMDLQQGKKDPSMSVNIVIITIITFIVISIIVVVINIIYCILLRRLECHSVTFFQRYVNNFFAFQFFEQNVHLSASIISLYVMCRSQQSAG